MDRGENHQSNFVIAGSSEIYLGIALCCSIWGRAIEWARAAYRGTKPYQTMNTICGITESGGG